MTRPTPIADRYLAAAATGRSPRQIAAEEGVSARAVRRTLRAARARRAADPTSPATTSGPNPKRDA